MGWTILAFLLGQLFTFGRFILSLYTKVNSLQSKVDELEKKLKDNASKDEQDNLFTQEKLKQIEDLVGEQLKERNDSRESFRKEIYKECKRIEDKNSNEYKELQKRINDIAQGLVIVETRLESKR